MGFFRSLTSPIRFVTKPFRWLSKKVLPGPLKPFGDIAGSLAAAYLLPGIGATMLKGAGALGSGTAAAWAPKVSSWAAGKNLWGGYGFGAKGSPTQMGAMSLLDADYGTGPRRAPILDKMSAQPSTLDRYGGLPTKTSLTPTPKAPSITSRAVGMLSGIKPKVSPGSWGRKALQAGGYMALSKAYVGDPYGDIQEEYNRLSPDLRQNLDMQAEEYRKILADATSRESELREALETGDLTKSPYLVAASMVKTEDVSKLPSYVILGIEALEQQLEEQIEALRGEAARAGALKSGAYVREVEKLQEDTATQTKQLIAEWQREVGTREHEGMLTKAGYAGAGMEAGMTDISQRRQVAAGGLAGINETELQRVLRLLEAGGQEGATRAQTVGQIPQLFYLSSILKALAEKK